MKKIKKLLFNRVMITGILVLLQLGFILLEVLKLGSFYFYLSILLKGISTLVAFYLICKPMNPEMKLAWIVPVLLFPLFGGLIFLLYGHVIIPIKLRSNLSKVKQSKIRDDKQTDHPLERIEKEDRQIANQFRYIENYGGIPVCQNSEAVYYKCGEDYFKALKEALRGAQHFIFMEYFIIKPGKMWDEIHTILKEKVKEGVEVRVMYDDVGSGFSLPSHYTVSLEAEGIRSIAFNKLFPIMALILNNRDHRKIVVVDGKIAFTGGINIADEYINEKAVYGHWKDAGVSIKGEAVWYFTVLFLQMWNAMQFTESDYERYKAVIPKASYTDGYIQPYGSDPLERERIGETAYFNMLSSAQSYIYIYTPYLIIDHDMLSVLERAAKRGVEVRIVTPGIPDKKKVYWLTQSYYDQLLKAGVHIMQYKPGFIHAKCILCDDQLASVGTINFDYRSFYHHFECGVLMYRCKACLQLKQDMEEVFSLCEAVDKKWCSQHIKVHLVRGMLLKLFSPLL